MRKIFLVATLAAFAFVGGGCAGELANLKTDFEAVTTGISLATKSVANPVTLADLYAVESSIDIGFSALSAYKQACINGAADKNCRANIKAIQVYTTQIPPYLAQLRSFVKNNDQINASVVYNQLTTLYGNAKVTAANLGVSLGN